MCHGGGSHAGAKVLITEHIWVEQVDASLLKSLPDELGCDDFMGFHVLLDDVVVSNLLSMVNEVTAVLVPCISDRREHSDVKRLHLVCSLRWEAYYDNVAMFVCNVPDLVCLMRFMAINCQNNWL